MSYTQDFFSQRRNYNDGTTRIGDLGRLWYDSSSNTIRVANGAPGGQIVGTVTANPFNQNLNTYNDVQFNSITFTDNTTQYTAFTPTSAVTSLTAGVGLSVTNTVGDITIDNTGVTSATGTPNQVIVSQNTGDIVFSLPQDIAPSSTVVFSNLTVSNLTVTGNTYQIQPSVVVGTQLFLGNNVSTLAGINQGGIFLGNLQSGIQKAIYYNQSDDSWYIDGSGTGLTVNNITSGNLNAEYGFFNDNVKIGYTHITLDYPYADLQIDANINSYVQSVQQNHNPGGFASTDWISVNDIGNDGQNYIDFGINGSNYNDPAYSATKANDGYLYVNGGNLVIGTQTAGKYVVFTAGNLLTSNIQGYISPTTGWTFNRAAVTGNLTVSGNVTTSNATVSGNVTTSNLTVSATSNLGSNGNVKITGGTSGQVLTTYGNGNLYWSSTPTVSNVGGIQGNNVNIDFSSVNQNILLYHPTNTVYLNLSNYQTGHQARVIIRFSASTYPVNLGVANVENSTTGGLTLPISGGGGHNLTPSSAIQLLYTCYDNTAGNCYVAATYF